MEALFKVGVQVIEHDPKKVFQKYWMERCQTEPSVKTQRDNIEHAFYSAWTLCQRSTVEIIDMLKRRRKMQ